MPRLPTRIDNSTGGRTTKVGTFALERTGARETDDAQTKARAATAPSAALPFGDGNLIANVSMLGGVPLRIQHRLGRAARGAFPVSIVGNAANQWTVQNLGTASDGSILAMVVSAAVVDWWVF